ncbi:TPA: RelA/SpoT domain-containing protein [Vibrio cholerae]|uniref:RelA/SpoT domain-containing protein n=2 Tax=Vibrio cholerae TaxID=666 RepID=UPI0011DA1FB6|nr:RelA/SpoT domain-containing protein [Vibrio cholerae]EKF9139910.1 RelA/SpoT domain-containing protein [Vibrio cholerae]TXZ82001.1 RelA/SpoT domain-containing protein [Vibrio cholerae]GIA39395.1 (p)ppGpp synthetase [Vibrio cholerae]HDV5287695.1 RelA/SpoT domain-containing protein [Vibrio cholerae]HDV5461147.1 RelA/SpoT domain-containing protein [Vibrio cholerae]
MNNQSIDEIIQLYESERHYFERFMNGVVDTFKLEPRLNKYGSPIIYTIKNRLKDVDHLRDKLVRKWDNENPITPDNFFQRVTDLAGVRVLHLYQDQFSILHEHINKQVESGDWFLKENPVAYSWDPESTSYFQRLGIDSKIKDSYYTSIHYVVMPKSESNICCEIQVRTLFEEIWGEIDHTINYPHPTQSVPCKEQLRVLSKLVSTGTRLADSIFRTHNG